MYIQFDSFEDENTENVKTFQFEIIFFFQILNLNIEIQWTYQTCNEFGFYQTSDKKEKIFGDRFPLDFFVKQCTDIYGHSFDADYLSNSISNTNKYYGALNPKTTNVLYVHGSIDPWHALGIVESNDPRVPTIYIEGE